MFVDNKEELADALFVKDEKGHYLMLEANSDLPENYKVEITLKDVPKSIIKLLSTPRRIEENLRTLTEEHMRVNNYLSRIFGYEATVAEILKKSTSSQVK